MCSYGNYVLFGFGDGSVPSNGVQVHQVGAAMGAAMDAVKLPQANYYLVGNSGLVLYGTSGSAQDYGQVNICQLEIKSYANTSGQCGITRQQVKNN